LKKALIPRLQNKSVWHLKTISSQEDWQDIIKSYSRLYNSTLLQEMSSELQASEYSEMLQIIASKPLKKGQAPSHNVYQAWAKRFKAAFDKTYGFISGTDEAALLAVIAELPTQHAFIQTGVAYQKLYGANIIDAMKAEGELSQYYDWLARIFKKPKR
jgi:hypothetical protein